MLKGIRSRLTFANVISLVALFVALGGSAYAVTQIDRNSVKSKHIAPNEAKGVDIDEATLKQVPAAADADTLDGSDSAAYQAIGSDD